MTTRSVWIQSVPVDQALSLINNGYGRLRFRWDERIWHYWQRLRWDVRPRPTWGDDPPEEVDAYLLTPAEAHVLGVTPDYDDVPCVLFILYEMNTESCPIRAAVVGDARPEVADDA
jgi:hypothetical protein